MIIISRFILNLRRSDQVDWSTGTRLSTPCFAASKTSVTTTEGFVGEMGRCLDHGTHEAEAPDDNYNDSLVGVEAVPAQMRANVEDFQTIIGAAQTKIDEMSRAEV